MLTPHLTQRRAAQLLVVCLVVALGWLALTRESTALRTPTVEGDGFGITMMTAGSDVATFNVGPVCSLSPPTRIVSMRFAKGDLKAHVWAHRATPETIGAAPGAPARFGVTGLTDVVNAPCTSDGGMDDELVVVALAPAVGSSYGVDLIVEYQDALGRRGHLTIPATLGLCVGQPSAEVSCPYRGTADQEPNP